MQFARPFYRAEMVFPGQRDASLPLIAAFRRSIWIRMTFNKSAIHQIGCVLDVLRNKSGVVVVISGISLTLNPLRLLQAVNLSVCRMRLMLRIRRISLHESDVLVFIPNLVQKTRIDVALRVEYNDVSWRHSRVMH